MNTEPTPTAPPQLVGQPAELHMVVEIKRAATGEVETYHMTGHVTPQEKQDVCNPL